MADFLIDDCFSTNDLPLDVRELKLVRLETPGPMLDVGYELLTRAFDPAVVDSKDTYEELLSMDGLRLDGEDTLMALRMIAPNLPVVLTSGYGEQAVVQRFVGRGLADFLPKPFMTEALVHAINTAIERTRVGSS